MKVILVDDELSARRRLGRLLRAFPDVEVCGEAHNGLEALSLIESTGPDLVLLDVRMPELDGLEMIRTAPAEIRIPLVVFVTSYDDHAMEAFNTNAVAYLLKPVEEPRLAAALDRVRRLLQSDQQRAEDGEKTRAIAERSRLLTHIVCRKHNRLLLVSPSEILWFYTDEGIVRAHTNDDNYWANYQLNELERGLDPDMFFRARRELLVNLSRVKLLKPYEGSTFALVMDDAQGTEIIVSERRAKDLRVRFPGL